MVHSDRRVVATPIPAATTDDITNQVKRNYEGIYLDVLRLTSSGNKYPKTRILNALGLNGDIANERIASMVKSGLLQQILIKRTSSIAKKYVITDKGRLTLKKLEKLNAMIPLTTFD